MPYQWNYKFYYELFHNVMEIDEAALAVLVQFYKGKTAILYFRASRNRGLFLEGFRLLFYIYHPYLLMWLLVSIHLDRQLIIQFYKLSADMIFIIFIFTLLFLFSYF